MNLRLAATSTTVAGSAALVYLVATIASTTIATTHGFSSSPPIVATTTASTTTTTTTTNSFAPPFGSSFRISSSCLQASSSSSSSAGGGGSGSSTNKNQKKSPRFSQDAHQSKSNTNINNNSNNKKRNGSKQQQGLSPPSSEADEFFRRREGGSRSGNDDDDNGDAAVKNNNINDNNHRIKMTSTDRPVQPSSSSKTSKSRTGIPPTYPTSNPRKSPPPPTTTTSTVTSSSSSSKTSSVFPKDTNININNSKDYMWKTTKSIEDLEDRMTARWGTSAQQWTADPNEYEFVYDDDDEVSTTTSNNSNNNKGPKEFRGKPVTDPWENKKDNKNMNTPPPIDDNREGGIFAISKEDVVMNRVRRNQERNTLEEATTSRRPVKVAKWKDLVMEEDETEPSDDNDEDEFDMDDDDNFDNDDDNDDFYDEEGNAYDDDDDFYDDDDERDSSNDEAAIIGRLIAPKPVGGRGSLKPKNSDVEPRPESSTIKATWESGNLEAPVSPGFFFNPNAIPTTINDKTNLDTGDQRKNRVFRQHEATPLLDKDGNPLYLTVDQAKTFFATSASMPTNDSSNSNSDSTDAATSWEELGITSPQLLRNLQAMGCMTPLSVQDKACPTILTGNDVLVGTYTGSGKTLAFLVPLIQRLLLEDAPEGIQVLIVAPGRELASQIVSVARDLLVATDMSTMLAIGGTTFARNLEGLRKKKPTILVGTPGRMAELIVGKAGEKRGRLSMSSLKAIVLDEFDALLEYKPHRDPTAALVQVLKSRHRDSLQSILCSATASDMMGSAKLDVFLRAGYVMAMADRDDRLVTDGGSNSKMTRVSKTVIHGVVHVPQKRLALDAIRRILHTEPLPQQVLIFADNARRVEILIDKLDELGIVAAPLHGGDKSEKMDRAEVSKALREGYVGIVVATELAARGLDAPLLTHVINLDLPTDASHYAHRAGRCGRGGRPGVVINITTGPKERNVPKRFAEQLGVEMYTVEVKNAKLNLVDPLTIDLDPPPER